MQAIAAIARGLGALACAHNVALVGGNTTHGPLSVTIQVLGHVPRGCALRRSGGAPGDAVFLSGTAGDAAAGLLLEQGKLALEDEAAVQELRARFAYPTPRVALGEHLRGHANACIDISDGLLGDAAKLTAASGYGVEIAVEELPLSRALLLATIQNRIQAARSYKIAVQRDPLTGCFRDACFRERLQRRLASPLDVPAFERHLAHLKRDFHIDVRPGKPGDAYRLGAFKAFVGQDDHLRHEAFVHPAKIS